MLGRGRRAVSLQAREVYDDRLLGAPHDDSDRLLFFGPVLLAVGSERRDVDVVARGALYGDLLAVSKETRTPGCRPRRQSLFPIRRGGGRQTARRSPLGSRPSESSPTRRYDRRSPRSGSCPESVRCHCGVPRGGCGGGAGSPLPWADRRARVTTGPGPGWANPGGGCKRGPNRARRRRAAAALSMSQRGRTGNVERRRTPGPKGGACSPLLAAELMGSQRAALGNAGCGGDQQGRVRVSGGGEHLVDGAVLDDPPAVQDRHPGRRSPPGSSGRAK